MPTIPTKKRIEPRGIIVSTRVTPKIRERMNAFVDVNWAEVIRRHIESTLSRLEKKQA